MLTVDQLYSINNNTNKTACENYITSFNDIMPDFEIDTPLRVCHFLAQVLHESGHLAYTVENLNYSASALRAVFSKYFPTDELANEYARQPERIANRVYANRMSNGDEASGDGWKYRGRGLIQLTGKYNYELCGMALDLDLLSDPDLISTNSNISLQAACWFWTKNCLNSYADADDILTITKRINGGTNGLADRELLLEKAKAILL